MRWLAQFLSRMDDQTAVISEQSSYLNQRLAVSLARVEIIWILLQFFVLIPVSVLIVRVYNS